MTSLFTWLNHALQGAPLIAILASLFWGVCSVVLSPCHMASIPLIIGFIDNQGRGTARRAFVLSSLFAVGILLTIAAIGLVTNAVGHMLSGLNRYGMYIAAVVFFAVGLHLLDVIHLPLGNPRQVKMQRRGLLAAFILGLVFGVALGPCTFAFMAPVLAVTFSFAASQALYGAALLLAYGIGHCAVIVAAGTSTELVQRYLTWNERSGGANLLRRICGVLVLIGGVYVIYMAP